ncbi:hypothetical protein O6H91_03G061300 [Diphasiastrum complanatum]|uniref:Uncharacterized protein n=1 Tax=Diphasiastrum complanatum TaxID=34168 RepID=A0ACC2E776_DIPCM|nr:hypothetical protein O6H91_03G061300 [Diphasiastrum complanatum]
MHTLPKSGSTPPPHPRTDLSLTRLGIIPPHPREAGGTSPVSNMGRGSSLGCALRFRGQRPDADTDALGWEQCEIVDKVMSVADHVTSMGPTTDTGGELASMEGAYYSWVHVLGPLFSNVKHLLPMTMHIYTHFTLRAGPTFSFQLHFSEARAFTRVGQKALKPLPKRGHSEGGSKGSLKPPPERGHSQGGSKGSLKPLFSK